MTPKEDKVSRETTPSRLPDVKPPVYQGQNYDFTLQAVFEMQGKLGELTQAIKTLTEDSREHGRELKHIGKVMYAAGVLIPVISVIGMWVLGRLWEFVIAPALKLPSH
jgi:hypothetical protein